MKRKTMTSFWHKLGLSRPFFALAPMADVTDAAFRKLITKYGKPDVMWTEFVSADGLISPKLSPLGRKKVFAPLKFTAAERPIVAQVFTSHPEAMRQAAKLIAELDFDGLDINMGCPDRSVEKQGGGAAMMKDPKTAIAVLQAAREGWGSGARDGVRGSVISVKTRLGYNKVDLSWIQLLLEQRLPALTIHLRTRKEMSNVPAHWELMPEILTMRDDIQSDLSPEERTLIIGNGDVESLEDARAKAAKYGCDGVMIGRGIFGKPWFFGGLRSGSSRYSKESKNFHYKERTPAERLKIMLEHTTAFERAFGITGHATQGVLTTGKILRYRLKNFAVMKKHFKAYVSGWDGARELRVKLMSAPDLVGVKKIVRAYLKAN